MKPEILSLTVTAIVFLLMAGEGLLSGVNERMLRAEGAVEPTDDVYWTMAWAYPASFVAMALEGAMLGPRSRTAMMLGVVVFAAAKAIKYWAIASLGRRWSFRVLVLPGAPLVTHGPYAWVHHPNYIGVVGEMIGMALLVGAPVTGAIATLGFALLVRRRIVIEDRALGRDHTAAKGV